MRRNGEGEKGRCLPWSKEEEGAYIFWMKQVPVACISWSVHTNKWRTTQRFVWIISPVHTNNCYDVLHITLCVDIISFLLEFSFEFIKIRYQQKCQNYLFINVWRKSTFDIYFTEFGAALTTVLPVLFKYCYKYCYSDSRKLWAVMKGGGLAL